MTDTLVSETYLYIDGIGALAQYESYLTHERGILLFVRDYKTTQLEKLLSTKPCNKAEIERLVADINFLNSKS